MKTTLTPNIGQVKNRIDSAAYTVTYKYLWGGTRLCMDSHALRRSRERLYEYMSYELLADNIADLFSNDELEEQVLYELPMGSKFVVIDEKTGWTVFASIGGIDERTGANECFIHSVFNNSRGKWERSVVFCEPETKGLYRIATNGELIFNPPELLVSAGRR